MNSVYYIYDADFCDLEELPKPIAEEKLAERLNILLCDALYDGKRQCGLENATDDVLRPRDTDLFCDEDKILINPGGHSHVFCFAFQIFS